MDIICRSRHRTTWLILIALLLLYPKLVLGDVCGSCEDDCLPISSITKCICQRKVSYAFTSQRWDPWQGRYVQTNSEISDIKVKCFLFKEPYVYLSSLTCSETKCSDITFTSSNISTVPINFFKDLPYLKAIYLDDSQVQNLQVGAFTGLSYLHTLQLEKNRMKNIKAGCFHTLSTLKTLDLHENLIETIDKDAFLGLISLEELDLSRNKLITVSKGIFEPLENLRTLILSGNQLESVDFDLNALSKLGSLYLNHNKITTFETCFENMKLDTLFLQDNEITWVNESCFPNTLSSLNMANNQISHLDFLQEVSSLTSLNLSANRIGQMAINTFQNSGNLLKIDLSQNEISQLKIGIFSKTDRLEYLNLSSVQLEELDARILVPLRSLTVLDITDNDINFWDSGIFSHFNNFQKFFVQGNNFTCDVVSSLFLQSKERNFSLVYETDYSSENIKGLPCSFGVQQPRNSTANETKPNDMTKLRWDDLTGNLKNISSLMKTNLETNIEMKRTMKGLKEEILTKIATLLKSEFEEDKDEITSELFQLQNSIHEFLDSKKIQNTTTPTSANIKQEQDFIVNISLSNLEAKMDSSFSQLKVLVMLTSCLVFIYAIVKIVAWCVSSKKRRRSFDLAQELPIMSN